MLTRGQRVVETATGRSGMVIFVFPVGSPGQELPWAKVVFEGGFFTCRLLTELTPGGTYGA